ncbi:MAG TPA: hypothetical protein P5511_06705, partial [Candidatus Goldiibacteriota bacterium]|nr:hypothetical protein [Candidatus Goldiibacteriota bacterium]
TASPTYTVTPSISPTWTFGYGTHTITPTITFTGTRTASPSVTATSTRTNTVTAASATPTSTRTNTVPGTYTFTPTGTRTATASVVITSTNTPYQSPTMTYTAGACTCPGIFGSNTTGTYNYDVSGYFNSSRFELAEDAVASAINVNIGSTNGTARAMVAIYTNSVNRPDALVVEAGPYTVAAGWNNIAIPATPLTAGSYWLAIQFEPGAQLNFGYVPGGTTEYYYGPIAFGAFPVNADAGGYNDGGVYSMYVDYCPVVCGSPTPTRTASPTVTITPTYVGTCACEATTGKQYDATAGGNIMGWISMNWYGVAEEGNAQAISINVISGSGEVRVGLYADNGSGAPGILLSESQPTTVGPGWNRIEIGQAAVHAGNVYWLALQNGDNLVQVGREMGSMGDEVYVSYPYAAFPGAAPVMTAYSGLWDIKLHYCPVVCGATATETPANTNTPEPTFTATLIPTPTFTAIPGGSLVSVITAPLSAVVGSQITVIMNVSNNGSATIVNISPSTLTLSDPGAVSLVSGPQPGSISSLDAGASADFTWVYNVTAASASLTFGGNASGTHSITSETVTGPYTQSSG